MCYSSNISFSFSKYAIINRVPNLKPFINVWHSVIIIGLPNRLIFLIQKHIYKDIIRGVDIMNVVGIDISKGKSIVAVAHHFGEVVSKPFEIHHTINEIANFIEYLNVS